MIFLNIFLINLLITAAKQDEFVGFCDTDSKHCEKRAEDVDSSKLIFYDVNPAEGFNLRRDVYMRFAIMMSDAQKRGRTDWQLVLPPWTSLYHWNAEIDPNPQPWSVFFDVNSMKEFAPVVELHEVFSKIKSNHLRVLIDTLYVLENFENPFENGVFEDKWEYSSSCEYKGTFFGYQNMFIKETVCIKFQGKISKLWELVFLHRSDRKIMFSNGEIPLHDNYGTKTYWDCRKSMKFNAKLIDIAKKFMSEELACNEDKCSNYLSVHWRRRDFVLNRPDDVPSIPATVKQIDYAIKKYVPYIKKIFVASDCDYTEHKQLHDQLYDLGYEVYWFIPTGYNYNTLTFNEGSHAIVDQIISSRAAYFIGTHESTFTFRIQEEREILGFDSNSTFNRLCPDDGTCEKPSKWTIIN